METDKIINRVANSSLITIDLEQYYPLEEQVLIDIKEKLHQELILKEKDFREYIKTHNWHQYHGKLVAITCSSDAIIPTWAYMLLTIAISPHAKKVIFGTLQQLQERLIIDKLSEIDWASYKNKKVIVKGCNKKNIPQSIYIEVSNRLIPFASSIMFGEPCSTVPLFKRDHQINII